MTELHKQEVVEYFDTKGYKMIGDYTTKQNLHYICICGKERRQNWRDMIKRNCKWCKCKNLTEIKENDIVEGDEIWKPID